MGTMGDLGSVSLRRRGSTIRSGCSGTAMPTCREIALLHSTWLSDSGIRVAEVDFPEGGKSHRPAGVAQLLR